MQARPGIGTNFEVVVVPSRIRRHREAGAREAPRQSLEQTLACRPRLVPVGEMEAAAEQSQLGKLAWPDFIAETDSAHPRLPSGPGTHHRSAPGQKRDEQPGTERVVAFLKRRLPSVIQCPYQPHREH